MTPRRIVIIGNGRMAQRCTEILLAHAGADVRLVIAEDRADPAQARLAQFCARRGVRFLQSPALINDAAVVDRITGEQPHFVFSIDNFQVFGEKLLAVPSTGCINFHNGPLPRYRGVHIPSWAIFNGEIEHGITWHYMERAIDTGAIAAAASFPLTGTETALSLTLECVRVGVEVFARDLESILSGARTPAGAGPAPHRYTRRDLPNGARLDLRRSAAEIDRLLRATDFRPLPNPFTYAHLRCPQGELIVNEARVAGERGGHRPGEIVAAHERLVVACADRLLDLTAVMLRPDEDATIAAAIEALRLETGAQLG